MNDYKIYLISQELSYLNYLNPMSYLNYLNKGDNLSGQ